MHNKSLKSPVQHHISSKQLTTMLHIWILEKYTRVLQFEEDELLQLMKPIYGPHESGDYSDGTVGKHEGDEFKMEERTIGESLFFTRIANRET